MGRYSPTVLPERQESFPEAISDAIGTIRGAKQNRQQQDRLDRGEHREDERIQIARDAADQQKLRDQVELYNSGYRSGAPPQDESEAIAQVLAGQRGNMTQAGPGEAAAAPPNQPGNQTQGMAGPGATAQSGGPAVASAPSPIRQAGMQFYLLPGGQGYIDPRGTPEGRAESRDDRLATRQDARDDRIDTRQRERDDRLDTRADARDDRTAGREDARDTRRYRHDVSLEGMRERNALELEGLRGGGADPGAPKNLDKRYEQVQNQVNDDEQALTSEGKALGEAESPDSTHYKAIAAELDSLKGVRGRITSARGGDAGAVAGIRREAGATAYKTELRALEAKRQRALSMGVPQAKVDAAFAKDAAALGQKHRGTIGYGQ